MDDTRCGSCEHYALLATPFHYGKEGYPKGVTIYGFCTKSASNSSFYPVYLPDGGQCKDYKQISKRNAEGQVQV